MEDRITLWGQVLTLPEAEDYLARLKKSYELHKEKDHFFFDHQVMVTKFAHYLIQHLETTIKRKKGGR